jgi:hypothetical protein
MARRIASSLVLLLLALVAASAAQAGSAGAKVQAGAARANACAAQPYQYAGLAADRKAHGVAATLAAVSTPDIMDGHVGGWIGVGGTGVGPGGAAEWLQAGFAAFGTNKTRMYYEVTVPGVAPTFHELDPDVKAGEKHRFAVLEMAGRQSWWRVWVDGRPASPPIHLAGSHGAWYPQAVAENWNGNTGTCNGYAYRFENIALAEANGGKWRPFTSDYTFQDAGYKVVRSKTSAAGFLALSV